MRQDRAFTLIEIIVVIVIIMVVAGVLVPAVLRARRKGRETECINNMKQLHLKLQMYRDDHISQGKELNPPWLNTLVWDNLVKRDDDPDPDDAVDPRARPVMKQEVLICPLDDSKGKEGGKPPGPVDQFTELDEYDYFLQDRTGAGGTFLARLDPGARRERPCSYMYEFNMAAGCVWNPPWYDYLTLPGDGEDGFDPDAFVDLDGKKDPLNNGTKWGEVKTAQMKYGDTYINQLGSSLRGYPPSRFPVLRCFWHASDPDTDQPKIVNLSYEGQVFRSGARWERYTTGQ